MGFAIGPGPRGLSASWSGRQLASAYDPGREAARWADEQQASPGSLVFVAGDPWGLAAAALAERGVQAFALLPGSAARPHVPPGVPAWAPEDGPLERFVGDALDEWGPDAVSWQVWPAFERYAPEVALDWARRFRDVYRAEQGSWLTRNRFGPRFWTNAVRNTVEWQRPAALVPGTRPVVIAASGPSLEDSLSLLAEHRSLFELWALPSSFEPLLRRGFVPDAGIATDGGYYAREHLQRLAGTAVPVLAALSSAPDPVLAERPCLFFSQGLAVERQLLGSLLPGFGEVPSQGTVAVTAIELALAATAGPVFIAGLDLAFRDLRAHASPHTVDRRLLAAHSRLEPYEGLAAAALLAQAPMTVDGARTAPALVTYAGWFRSRARFARTVHRIAPSTLRWGSMAEVTGPEAAAIWRTAGRDPVRWSVPPAWPDRSRRRQAADRALAELAARVENASAGDAWVREAARTGAPRALAEEFQARRSGGPTGGAQAALAEFVRGLRRP